MLSKPLINKIQDILHRKTGSDCSVKSFVPVPGGSINKAYALNTDKGVFFVKLNNAKAFPGMFEAEAKGLELLKKNSKFQIPDVIAVDYLRDDAFILMEHIEKGPSTNDFFQTFGRTLALMHKQSNKKFGLDHDNYIGSLAQSNKQQDNWIGFFIEERMEKQLKLAIDSKTMSSEIKKSFERLYKRLNELMPEEPAALIHGDLWSGNYLSTRGGIPCIIDPAVYYGHREMDLAMTKLFGGFSPAFYQSYFEEYPLEKGWEKRLDGFQLYPLMVHVNLFGGSYVEDVRGIVKRF